MFRNSRHYLQRRAWKYQNWTLPPNLFWECMTGRHEASAGKVTTNRCGFCATYTHPYSAALYLAQLDLRVEKFWNRQPLVFNPAQPPVECWGVSWGLHVTPGKIRVFTFSQEAINAAKQLQLIRVRWRKTSLLLFLWQSILARYQEVLSPTGGQLLQRTSAALLHQTLQQAKVLPRARRTDGGENRATSSLT